MKKIFFSIVLLFAFFKVNAQDHYNAQYSLGLNSGGKWYKLFQIDLNDNGAFNSANISVDYNYVSTTTKYNSSAKIRLREGPNVSLADWQNNVSGTKQSVLKLKKISSKIYELWGYSNGAWGHFSFECSITKESTLIINIPESPILISDTSLYEDVPTKGEWYFPSGDLIVDNGNVGIGTTNNEAWKLAVNGNIRAKEIKVETEWADFVFNEDYKLPTLQEVENHIKENKHLKDIPSAKEVEENGIFLGEMDSKLLLKIEELTLYLIQQQKEIEKLKLQNKTLLDLQLRLEQLELELELEKHKKTVDK
ncbi:hypothetical protein [Olleya sp. HaHaR_3_96]|uniref:hypothetical protein n=1 Tax=Olleya sp. HaHaR_3_96 TaxID=2745560 RepID=UPI001C501E07|nr:hypothetical protein [Olleya sp. HaHaR_3_96]QXP60425.1 hypothetical protein H0I26_01915 [Olleya sp. HaHaR_3_96]